MEKKLHPSLKGAPLAIVEAAERLFGEHGIENVSLRQIRLEAGMGNNSAVTYHFSDREKLVRAIWDIRLPELDHARRILVDALVAEGRQSEPDAVMRALMLPNFSLKDRGGVHRYAAFFRHALRWKDGMAIRNSHLSETPASNEALSLFYALRSDLSPDILNYRLRYGACMFFDMIVDRDAGLAVGATMPPEKEFLDNSMSMLVAMSLA